MGKTRTYGGPATRARADDARPAVRRALFLDRDGVINVDRVYVSRREHFAWCEGIFELARAAHLRGYALVVVTNQSGIGRGLYTEADFAELTRWMCAEMARRGAPVTNVYYCPYHPEATITRYRADHPWRKPSPGMLLQAGKELDLDLSQSILVGDRASDIAAASRAGVGTSILVGSEQSWPEARPSLALPDVRATADWFAQHAEVQQPSAARPVRRIAGARPAGQRRQAIAARVAVGT